MIGAFNFFTSRHEGCRTFMTDFWIFLSRCLYWNGSKSHGKMSCYWKLSLEGLRGDKKSNHFYTTPVSWCGSDGCTYCCLRGDTNKQMSIKRH